MALTLLVVGGPARGGVLELPGDRLVLGRRAESLGGDGALSGEHAEVIRVDDGSLVVRDLDSRNGTWVNSVRIARPRVLRPGDVVQVGRSTLNVVGARDEGEDTAAHSPPPARGAGGGVAIDGGQHAGDAGVVAGRDIHGNVQTSYVDRSRHYQQVDVDTSGASVLLRTRGVGRALVVLGSVLALAGFVCFAYPIVRGIVDAASGDAELRRLEADCREQFDDPFDQSACIIEARQNNTGPTFEATPWIPLGGILFVAGIALTWAGVFTVRRDDPGDPGRY